MSAANDDHLARLLQQSVHRAHEGFWQLHARHAPRLLIFLCSRAGRREEAEAVHRQVWLRVWRTLPGFPGGNFRTWLYDIARECLDEHVFSQDSPRSADGPEGDESDWLEGHQEAVQAWVNELEQRSAQAGAIVRARMGGASVAEIGADLGATPDRIRKLLHAARRYFRSSSEKAA
jgi:DNA-directed RNA polymerase specialized sigma24 family protein